MKLYKTVECQTVQKKMICIKDRDCFYYHKHEEMRRSPYGPDGVTIVYSHTTCQEKCGKPNCKYAHNDVEVMYHPYIYKTKPCNDHDGHNKTCKKGRWCAFAHGEDDLRVVARFNNSNGVGNGSVNGTNGCSNGASNGLNGSGNIKNGYRSVPLTTVNGILNTSVLSTNLQSSVNELSPNSLLYPDYYDSHTLQMKSLTIRYGVLKVDKENNLNAYLDLSASVSPSSDAQNNPNERVVITGLLNRNRAFDGDIVAVDLSSVDDPGLIQGLRVAQEHLDRAVEHIHTHGLPSDSHLKQHANLDAAREGRVVSIISANHRQTYTCVLRKSIGDIAYLAPVDHRLIGAIATISMRSMSNSKGTRDYYEVTVQGWPANQPFPLCQVTNAVACIDELSQSVSILKSENKLNVPFSDQTESEVKLISLKAMNINNVQQRKDLRNMLTFSVSHKPEIQTLFSCCQLSNGNIKYYVHVTDASFYIKAKSVIDNEASARGSQIDMGSYTSHILPADVIKTLSLQPGKDCCAITIEWEMHNNQPTSENYVYQSVVSSSGNLTYDDVRGIIENDTLEHTKMIKQQAHRVRDLIGDIKRLYNNMKLFHNKYRDSSLTPLTGETSIYHDLTDQIKQIANYIACNVKNLHHVIYVKSIQDLPPKVAEHLKSSHEKHSIKMNTNQCTMAQLLGDLDGHVMAQQYILQLDKQTRVSSYSTKEGKYLQYPFSMDITSPLTNYADLHNQRMLVAAINSTINPDSLLSDHKTVSLPDKFQSLVELTNHLEMCQSLKTRVERLFEGSIIGIWIENIGKTLYIDLRYINGCTSTWIRTNRHLLVMWDPSSTVIDCVDCPVKKSLYHSQDGMLSSSAVSLYPMQHMDNPKQLVTLKLSVYDPIQVQVSSLANHLRPKFFIHQLCSLKNTVPLCHEHLTNKEIYMLSKYPFEPSKTIDTDSTYMNHWSTLVDINSTHKSIVRSNSVYAFNVTISWSKKKKKYVGSFNVPLNQSPLAKRISRGDFLCLRYTNEDKTIQALHTFITKANYEEKCGRTLCKFSIRSAKLTQKVFVLEIIFRDEFNRNLINGVQSFTELNTELKEIILDQKPFQYHNNLGIDNLKINLTPEQQKIIQQCINYPLTIVEGPPGAGKSTIASLICRVAVGDPQSNNGIVPKVLLSGPNDHSVDWSFKKLMRMFPNIKALRVYKSPLDESAEYIVPEDIKPYSLHYQVKVDPVSSNSRDREGILLNDAKVICCTSDVSMEKRITDLNIPWVIVDNANQELEPTTICKLNKARHLVLLGDSITDIHDSEVSIKKHDLTTIFTTPLARRLKNVPTIKIYPTHATPMVFNDLGDLPYDPKSIVANTKPLLSFFDISDSEEKLDIKDFDSKDEHRCSKYINEREAAFISYLVNNLVRNNNANASTITVISPYCAQRWLIRRYLSNYNFTDIKVMSHIEAAYTRTDCAIVSLVRTSPDDPISFDNEQYFLRNLLLTTKGLIFIGNINCLENNYRWKSFASKIRQLKVYSQTNMSSMTNPIFTMVETENLFKLNVYQTITSNFQGLSIHN
ncbi:hypothetical protein SAMD00019534_080270 [Acytostelium subglobosum LB1]|uniref:hypothetical protein n=1 Tax=Acytostelium subglobosum LB1 TaxID=1410327 RepID=UPI0006450919|nr:hypothetical protein SAMD00019534_080270 [Acytostelium subglobosum LB1]GAM24852.1 hypothetical protein SAMD00019534_080270 [Acytostelium subglobosum LB1]|eukprot:XP_012751941.1 hypothetical protein SAMD00019534_080270 [Acytostelium subglobosum LB1]